MKGLGSGAVVTPYLPPGSDTITLTATDSLGRKSTATWRWTRGSCSSVVPLTLLNGWTNAPYGTADAGVSEANGVVRFRVQSTRPAPMQSPSSCLLRSDRRRTCTS